VRDTGIGMDAANFEQLLEPFRQADNSHTRRHGGTGLGLAIANRLVAALGGTLSMSSRPGRGSELRVSLRVGHEDPVPMICSAEELGLEPRSYGFTELVPLSLTGNVLVAEDDEASRRLACLFLEQVGLNVVAVENGQDAVAKAMESVREGRPYELILMDMQMPTMDGYEATRSLRQSSYREPIIAFTAHAMAEDRERCLESGCDDYITKPIEREEFLWHVQAWLDGNRPV